MMQRAKNLERRQQQSIQQKKSLLQDAELEASLALQPREAPKRRLLEARGLVLYQGGRPLCRPLDLTLEQGERLAILGRNGAGKSTLLRLCAGEDVAYTGTFYRAPGLEQNTVPQQTHHLRGGLRDLARQQQVEESLLLALLRQMGLERRHLERPVEQMSEGQRKKVLLALAFCRPYMLYLWDEPMNYIDVITRMQLEEAVQDSRGHHGIRGARQRLCAPHRHQDRGAGPLFPGLRQEGLLCRTAGKDPGRAYFCPGCQTGGRGNGRDANKGSGAFTTTAGGPAGTRAW